MDCYHLAEMMTESALTLLSGMFSAFARLLVLLSSGVTSFSVNCDDNSCPASAYNLVTAAWANIGYMTHADFLYLINKTNFSAWAPLLYIIGAIGGLIGVAINSPPRNYVWFFLGPCVFNFLEFTTTPVKGVSWKVAGVQQDMKLVWRDAESGLANTQLVKRDAIQVTRDDGPQGRYEVAWMLVFLDRLFSASTDGMVKFIGIGSQRAGTGQNTNLAGDDGSAPWFRMSTAKWGMLENVVGVSARDPNVRDALVTFLGSECGDHFKKGVDNGKYIASQSNRGMSVAPNVLKISGDSAEKNYDGSTDLPQYSYEPFAHAMDTEVLPTPRSIIRLFNQQNEGGAGGTRGNFTNFSKRFEGDKKFESGRGSEIVCTEILYTVIQALRWEAGHAYWQLLRSAPGVCEDQSNPSCFTKEQVLRTLFYGWDIRPQKIGPYATDAQLEDFTKYLIFLYMLRNELMFAPQITESGQRFSPAEQTKNFSESYVRQQGSRAKAAELYNWAVMMPHVQGILTYLVMIFYPFAAMFMVIPGYWKAFFTWISFLAWVKLWDVGFAIVHALERSVWAMLGNHSSMARVANGLIQTGQSAQILVDCEGTSPAKCAIPNVKEAGQGVDMTQAWRLLDRTLLLMGTADLDLANGYYIYIMSALYFAVPAVAGQLVLGAKAGMASMAVQGISQVAGEAGNAAKAATVGENVNKLQTNQGSLAQAAVGKSHRQTGLALQQLDNANAALDAGIAQGRLGGVKSALDAAAGAAGQRADSYKNMAGVVKDGFATAGAPLGGGGGQGGSGGKGFLSGKLGKTLGAGGTFGLSAGQNQVSQLANAANVRAASFGADSTWANTRSKLGADGFGDYGRKLGAEADFAAQTAAWEAKNDMATHLSGMAGVAGMNPGSLNPGMKPTDATGMAMSGQLGSGAQNAAQYSGFGFVGRSRSMVGTYSAGFGGSFVTDHWSGGFGENGSQLMGTGKVLRNAGEALTGFEDAREVLKEDNNPKVLEPFPPSENKN
jgi:hypothetical protein